MQASSQTPGGRVRILVVDDEVGMRQACRKVLEAEGFEVVMAEDGAAGFEAFRSVGGFAGALVDLKMPKMGGIELIEKIRALDEDILLLVITAYATIETAVEATKRGAYGYIPKPFTPDELLLPIRNGLERRALALEAKQLRLERERQQQELAKAKAMFVSLVAHEVKSPLAAIEGYLGAVLEEREPALAGPLRPMIERSLVRARALRQMVTELMNLRAIESGHFVLRREPVDLAAVVSGVVAGQREAAEAAGVGLEWVAPDGQAGVPGDEKALAGIAENLIGNAIKYTPRGGRVTVEVVPRGPQVELAVEDTGIGLSEEDRLRVFDEFFRVRNRQTAAIPGTGLGLSLVRRLVDLHGGQIEVASEPGHGSRFTVRLPAS